MERSHCLPPGSMRPLKLSCDVTEWHVAVQGNRIWAGEQFGRTGHLQSVTEASALSNRQIRRRIATEFDCFQFDQREGDNYENVRSEIKLENAKLVLTFTAPDV